MVCLPRCPNDGYSLAAASVARRRQCRGGVPSQDESRDWKRQERESITAALRKSGGKVFGPGGAAELLDMKPTTLASRVKALRLR